jgi:cysteinyl-tRNA synthetase
MDDDLNTPAAIAALQGLRSNMNKMLDKDLSTELRKSARDEFRSIGNVLGLFQLDKWQFNIDLAGTTTATGSVRADLLVRLSDTEIEGMIAERNEARVRKDFKRADEIRNQLAARRIIIEDKPDGTTRWKR